jgi:hypothetical protein
MEKLTYIVIQFIIKYKRVVGLPLASNISKISKYEADVELSVLSFISNSLRDIELTYE